MKLSKIVEAHENGETIQWKDTNDVWKDESVSNPNWYTAIEYRIKPKEPHKVTAECWLHFGQFKWILKGVGDIENGHRIPQLDMVYEVEE